MKDKRIKALPLLARCFLWVAVGAAGLGTSVSGQMVSETLVADVSRHYWLVVPPPERRHGPLPVVMVFHGFGNDGKQLQRQGFTELALSEGFIVVYPDGVDHRWNGGRLQGIEEVDDILFVRVLLKTLARRFPVDPKRIYATGESNGAIFCYTLAARLSDRMAAIGPVAGEMPADVARDYPPAGPVAVIAFNGTADTFVPFAGGPGLMSVAQTIGYWRIKDGCAPKPEIRQFPPSEADGPLRISQLDFAGGRSGAEVQLYVIEGGGHTWPGFATNPYWAKKAGKTAQSINATRLIWAFFAAHPKP